MSPLKRLGSCALLMLTHSFSLLRVREGGLKGGLDLRDLRFKQRDMFV